MLITLVFILSEKKQNINGMFTISLFVYIQSTSCSVSVGAATASEEKKIKDSMSSVPDISKPPLVTIFFLEEQK